VADSDLVAQTVNVWSNHIVWGDSVLKLVDSNHIVWGDLSATHVVWGDHIVWGDHVVWGDSLLDILAF
jgi:hypothetical protein